MPFVHWGSSHMGSRNRTKTGGYVQLTDAEQDRFWKKVRKTDGCWVWTASHGSSGYGQFEVRGQNWAAHRIAWMICRHHLPRWGFELDHLCRNRSCVRPSHMDVVTRSENLARRPKETYPNAMKERCHKGHEYDYAIQKGDRKGHRVCRECQKERQREHRRRKKAAIQSKGTGQ